MQILLRFKIGISGRDLVLELETLEFLVWRLLGIFELDLEKASLYTFGILELELLVHLGILDSNFLGVITIDWISL